VVAGSAALGAVMERLVLRHLYRRDHLVQLLATFAGFYILDDLASVAWGSNVRNVQEPRALVGGISLQHWQLPWYGIFVIGVAVVTGCLLWALLRRSSLGWRIRAAVGDSELLQLTGVNVPLLYTTVFALGAALAGLGGAIATPGQSVGPGLDVNVLVNAFAVAIIGGLGSITGAALAAVLIGMVQAYGTIYVSSLVPESVFIVMIVVLSLRPQGLLGRRGATE
jgi:branched-chain amino acid transport system permease protein